MVWVLAAGLALVALGLGIKVALLRHGIKALRQDLVERRGQDTNTLLSPVSYTHLTLPTIA